MSLADLLAARITDKPGPRCSVGRLLKTLDPDDAATLRDALAHDVAYEDLAAVLREMGHPISSYTLSRHARGRCQCGEAPRR